MCLHRCVVDSGHVLTVLALFLEKIYFEYVLARSIPDTIRQVGAADVV